jgi:hypothetical protein
MHKRAYKQLSRRQTLAGIKVKHLEIIRFLMNVTVRRPFVIGEENEKTFYIKNQLGILINKISTHG